VKRATVVALCGVLATACSSDGNVAPKKLHLLAGTYSLATSMTSIDSTIPNCQPTGASCVHSHPVTGKDFSGTLTIPGDTVMGVDAVHFVGVTMVTNSFYCDTNGCVIGFGGYVSATSNTESLPRVDASGKFSGAFALVSCHCSTASVLLDGPAAGDSITGTVRWFPASQSWGYSGTFRALRP